MDVTYFPFDDQYCKMIFASWAYHGGQVNITNTGKSGDLSSYSASGEFQLISKFLSHVGCLKHIPVFHPVDFIHPHYQ